MNTEQAEVMKLMKDKIREIVNDCMPIIWARGGYIDKLVEEFSKFVEGYKANYEGIIKELNKEKTEARLEIARLVGEIAELKQKLSHYEGLEEDAKQYKIGGSTSEDIED